LGAAGAAALPSLGEPLPQAPKEGKENGEKEPEVTATEDLMREHGVIRRALLVYFEVVPTLRQNAASVDAAALQQTAKLFRTFGEDYHERMLEEEHIFTVDSKTGKRTQALCRHSNRATQSRARDHGLRSCGHQWRKDFVRSR